MSRTTTPDFPTGTPLRSTSCTLWWSSLACSNFKTSAVPVVSPIFNCKFCCSKTCSIGGHSCEREQSSCQALSRGEWLGAVPAATTRCIPGAKPKRFPASPAQRTPWPGGGVRQDPKASFNCKPGVEHGRLKINSPGSACDATTSSGPSPPR